MLFGRVDYLCSRHGYVAVSDEKENKKHNKTQELPASTLTPVRPILPPELIIQDELHLITGPLGTIYSAYETIIEDMCVYGNPKIKPKYIVSTATIKNANEQTKCLYARKNASQFPRMDLRLAIAFHQGDTRFNRPLSENTWEFVRTVNL